MTLPTTSPVSTTAAARRHGGVTLIELIVVITITAIIAVVLGVIIKHPIEGYRAQVRRAELVDAADMALRRMARDIRQALPNSVRVDPTGRVIEMLNTVDGARYRVGPGNIGHNHGPTQFRLKIPGSDADGFNIVGFFQNITLPYDSSTQVPPSRLAIYNQTGTGATSAYADASLLSGSYVITNPAITTFTIQDDGGGDEWQILPGGASANFNFRWASPNQRVFIVDTPVTYVCDPASGTITRYWNYTITDPQPTNPAAAPLSAGANALLTMPVSACSFTYAAGTNQRAGLVTLDITLRDAASGEQVSLLYQAHVDNAP